MTFATFATWIVVGVVVAWGADAVMKHGRRGRTADIFLALAASGSAYLATLALGMFSEPGIVSTAVVAGAAAGTAIAVQRRFF